LVLLVWETNGRPCLLNTLQELDVILSSEWRLSDADFIENRANRPKVGLGVILFVS
jgi:hypothetical protein